ncbi:MAG: c-type cytochrome [Terracidiphilus sp.]
MKRSFAIGTGACAGFWALSLLLALAGPSRVVRASDSDDDDMGAGAKFSLEAAATFNGRCTACHTYGNGIKVGPDLKGATERRKRDWLLKFIHASSGVIKSGDPTATALFAQFKQQRMPDWVDLSEKQINDILDYIAIGGPDIKPADERNAATATSKETDAGRELFYGEIQTRYGAQACVNCHSVRGAGLRGGSLGPDLTGVYLRYQDLALTQFLRHTCFSWKIQTPPERYLTTKESFALKAFLRESAISAEQSSNAAGNLPPHKETGSNGK